MSLAAVVVVELSNNGVSLRKGGKDLSEEEAIEIMKGVVCQSLLTSPQGGLRKEQYFCDKCAENILSG